MGYRGEDASRSNAERQPPWQSSSGNGSTGAGPWDDGSRGYTQGYEDYGQDAADTGAVRRQDYGQQDYGPQGGYGQGEYGQGSYGQGEHGQGSYGQGGYGYEPDRPGPGPGGYQDPGSGGYRQQGGYPGQGAGNDWYGAQPAAGSGATFADTGSYRLNEQVPGDRDPVRGYPPASAPGGTGPQAAPRGRHSGQQARFDQDYAAYPGQGYGQGGPGGQSGQAPRGGSGGYPAVPDRRGYDDYAPAADPYTDNPYTDDPYGGDPYADAYEAGPDTPGRGSGPRGGGRNRAARRSRRPLFGALAVVAVAVLGVAAYFLVIKGHSTASNPNAAGAIPSVGSFSSTQAACAQELGTYCHIQERSGDPTPLTVTEVFPLEFQNTTDKISYSLAATKSDKTCANAVIGPNLIAALKTGQCNQLLRASYISGNGKIMGTIGVVNLVSTNQAHYAGKVVGVNDFVAPLDAPKGVASKMDNGTGLVEASFKGHYLILTWSIFVNGTKPTTKAEISELELFGKDLVAGTVNIPLSQRMVTGAPAVAGGA